MVFERDSFAYDLTPGETENEWQKTEPVPILLLRGARITSHSAFAATETKLYAAKMMDYYHQIFCRFRKCKRKFPPPSPLSNDFEKRFFFKLFSNDFFFANKIFSAI